MWINLKIICLVKKEYTRRGIVYNYIYMKFEKKKTKTKTPNLIYGHELSFFGKTGWVSGKDNKYVFHRHVRKFKGIKDMFIILAILSQINTYSKIF